jgi:hypothetical protein
MYSTISEYTLLVEERYSTYAPNAFPINIAYFFFYVCRTLSEGLYCSNVLNIRFLMKNERCISAHSTNKDSLMTLRLSFVGTRV